MCRIYFSRFTEELAYDMEKKNDGIIIFNESSFTFAQNSLWRHGTTPSSEISIMSVYIYSFWYKYYTPSTMGDKNSREERKQQNLSESEALSDSIQSLRETTTMTIHIPLIQLNNLNILWVNREEICRSIKNFLYWLIQLWVKVFIQIFMLKHQIRAFTKRCRNFLNSSVFFSSYYQSFTKSSFFGSLLIVSDDYGVREKVSFFLCCRKSSPFVNFTANTTRYRTHEC